MIAHWIEKELFSYIFIKSLHKVQKFLLSMWRLRNVTVPITLHRRYRYNHLFVNEINYGACLGNNDLM